MIYLFGDTHGSNELAKIKKCFGEIQENDYVIILGDFGIIWSNNKYDINESDNFDWLDKQNFTTLFLTGNHENFDRINKLKEIKKYNSKVGYASNKVFHLKNGNTYTIEGKTFFVMGGAESIDKCHRTEGLSWWKEEIPSQKEFDNGLDNLEKVQHEVDYVLTHTAPKLYVDTMLTMNQMRRFENINDPVEKYLDVVNQTTKYKAWYCGHWHVDYDMKNIHFLYENYKIIT